METTGRLTQITRAFDALVAAGADRDPAALTPGELVAASEAVGALRRAVDAVCARIASEVSRQSRPELGRDSLAKRQGHRSAEQMLSAATGVPVSEARRMVQVGDAVAPRVSLIGEQLPEKHPHVAAAVRAGTLGVAGASAIVGMLDRVAVRADKTLLGQVEQELARSAAGLRPDELSRLLLRAEALLDPDGLEPKIADIRAERALTISERDGMLLIQFQSDVASGAPVRAAIEGIVTATLNSNRKGHHDDVGGDGVGRHGDQTSVDGAGGHGANCADCHGATSHAHDEMTTGAHDDGNRREHVTGDDEPAGVDERSIRQMRADALIELCEHALGCESTPTRPTATVVVRMNLDALESGVGQATIDGTDHPIPAGEVRRMAATLQIIPVVLGGNSEILDLGRAVRLFTPAQKHAITERDGGCVGCGAPPAGATSTTSAGGPEVGEPTFPTGCCCARPATIGSTTTVGTSASTDPVPRPESG